MAKKKERSPTDTPDSTPILPGIVCTMQMYSDRNVYIVERLSKTGKTVYIKRAERLGKTGWVCRDTDEVTKVQRNDDGHWRVIGDTCANFVYMGVANPYFDRSF